MLFFLQVEPVDEPVHHRHEHDADGDQEYEARVQRVAAGEKLAARRLRIVDRTHASEDHRGIQEGIAPVEILEVSVARHADAERYGRKPESHGGVPTDAPHEEPARQQRRPSVLVHRLPVQALAFQPALDERSDLGIVPVHHQHVRVAVLACRR